MSFLYPLFIYLLLPLTLILFYFIMTGAKKNWSMFETDILEKLRSESKSLSRTSRNTLYLTAFVFMIIALAQPVIKEGEVVVEAKSADILIGIDISDSMKAEDRYPNRLEFAKNKAIELIKKAPHNRIGVLAFAKHDYIVSPLSFDHSSVAFLLSKVSTGNITEKGTHLDSMLASAISMLEHAAQKNLLLFTDGGDSAGFEKEIVLAKENGLRVFIIGIGSPKGSPVRNSEGGFVKQNGNILISKLNPQIKTLATQTGGVYIESVLGDGDINTMLKEIESITEKATLKKETIPQYTQLFYYPLALATLFVLLAFSSLPQRTIKSILIAGLVFIGGDDAKAGLLDFKDLRSAKEAYEQKEYNTSASIYERFSEQSSEANYNLANSLYKSNEYEKALQVYNKIQSNKPEFQAKVLHNRGNTLVKLKQYKEALQAFEKALELHEDKETRENYEAVKKLLEQEQEQQENRDNKDTKDQDNKSDQSKEASQKDDSNGEKSSQKKSSAKEKDKQRTDNTEENRSTSKQDKQQKPDQDEENKSSDKAQDVQDKVKNQHQEEQEQKSQENKGEEGTESEQEAGTAVPVNMKKMSELEAKKWFKMIQESQKGHLYKIQESEHEEDTNEKPW